MRRRENEAGLVRKQSLGPLPPALHQKLRQRFIRGRCGGAEQLVVAGRDAQMHALIFRLTP